MIASSISTGIHGGQPERRDHELFESVLKSYLASQQRRTFRLDVLAELVDLHSSMSPAEKLASSSPSALS